MRILLDANVAPRVARQLAVAGYDALHVGDVGMLGEPDEEILAYAAKDGRVIVSTDSDFATLLALAGLSVPSLVLLRSADHLPPDEQGVLLLENLPGLRDELAAGALVALAA